MKRKLTQSLKRISTLNHSGQAARPQGGHKTSKVGPEKNRLHRDPCLDFPLCFSLPWGQLLSGPYVWEVAVHCTQHTFLLALSPTGTQHFGKRDYRKSDYRLINLNFYIYQNKVANSIGSPDEKHNTLFLNFKQISDKYEFQINNKQLFRISIPRILHS